MPLESGSSARAHHRRGSIGLDTHLLMLPISSRQRRPGPRNRQSPRKMLGRDSRLDTQDKHQISMVLSPGSFVDEFGSQRPDPLPTGGHMKVVAERYTMTRTYAPDVNGRIIVVSLPCFESPFARLSTGDDGELSTAQAIPLPTYDSTSDPLQANKIYGYRLDYASMTSYNVTAVTEMSGTVTIANVPLSLDEKQVYDPSLPDGLPYIARCIDRPPLSSGEVASITSSFLTHNAALGAYCVSRHTSPELPFVLRDGDWSKAVFNAYTADVTEHTFTSQSVKNIAGFQTDAILLEPLTSDGVSVNPDSFQTSASVIPCSKFSSMNMGVTIYEGLSPETRLSFKFVVGLTLIPKLGSTKVGNAYMIPPDRPKFREALSLAGSLQPAVGTAADNDFKSFLGGLSNVWSAVSPLVKTVATVLPPQYQAPVLAISGLADAVSSTASKPGNPKPSKPKAMQPSITVTPQGASIINTVARGQGQRRR